MGETTRGGEERERGERGERGERAACKRSDSVRFVRGRHAAALSLSCGRGKIGERARGRELPSDEKSSLYDDRTEEEERYRKFADALGA